MTNDTCVKSFMSPQAHKFVSTHAHEISVWTIISRLLHSCAPHIGGTNGDGQSDLATLAFKYVEQHEYFHSRVLRLKQEVILSGETVSPTRLLFQFMKALSRSYKFKSFITPNMTDLITFLDNNVKYTIYTGRNIHGLHRYLEMIRYPTKLTTSGQISHHFVPSSSNNNYIKNTQPVIATLIMRQKTICKCCGRIVHKADTCIIRDPKLLPPSLIIMMNKFNDLHGEESTEPPIDSNIQTPEAHFRSRNSPPKTSPVVSAIIGRLNHCAVDNSDVEVHPSEFPVESKS